MLHLAIECSALAGSVAVLRQQTVIVQQALPPSVGSVQTLAPAVAELLALHRSGKQPPVELISVTHGPGSFTGLRGGLALAKMLGLAWKIPLVAVDTLHVMAAQTAHELTSRGQLTRNGLAQEREELAQGRLAEQTPAIVVSVLNAFRKQVFAGAWRIPIDSPAEPAVNLIPVAQPQVLSAAEWQTQPLAALVGPRGDHLSRSHLSSPGDNSSGRTASHFGLPVWISGAGLRNYTPHLDADTTLADPTSWDATAGWVGRLGWHSYLAGQAVSAAQLAPNYVRCSAAEETRAARG